MKWLLKALYLLAGAAVVLSGVTARAQDSAPAAQRLAVMPVQARPMPPTQVTVLSEALVTALTEALAMEIIAPEAVDELLKPPLRKLARNCQAMPCWVRLGKTLDVPVVLKLKGTLARHKLTLAITVVDAANKKVVARHSSSMLEGAAYYPDEMKRVIGELAALLPPEMVGGTNAPQEPTASATGTTSGAQQPAGETAPAADTTAAAQAPATGAAVTTSAASAAASGTDSSTPPAADAVAPAAPAYLGIAHSTVTPSLAQQIGLDPAAGTVVQRVTPGGPAANAGIQPGDVVTAIDNLQIRRGEELRNYLASMTAGTPIQLTLWRGGRAETVAVVLGTKPQ